MKKILYLHGLESDQGGKKVDYLSSKYMVCAPELDYKDPECFEKIYFLLLENDFDLIVGSSMGGYLAFIMGEMFELPTVLFNPALHSRSFEPRNQFKPKLGSITHNIILGEFDTVISADKTIKFLKENNISYNGEVKEISHRTPLNIFIDAVDKRVNQLGTLSNITSKF